MSPSAARFDGLICSVCGYDLRGLPENVCPECGVEFNPDHIKPAKWKPSRQAGLQAAIASLVVSPSLIGMYTLLALECIDIPSIGTCGTFHASRTDSLFLSGVVLVLPLWLWATSAWAGCSERIARNALLAAATAWITSNFIVWNQYAF